MTRHDQAANNTACVVVTQYALRLGHVVFNHNQNTIWNGLFLV